MNTKPTFKCKHVWIEGAVDFGFSYTNDHDNIDMFYVREHWSNILKNIGISGYQLCAICYLEKKELSRSGTARY